MTTSLAQVQAQIRTVNPDTEILAVSKLQPIEKIRDLFSQGQRKFGENYAQEALEKQTQLKDLPIEWHFIGRLQKNKVKFVVGNFFLIHSVDSIELAQAIDRKAHEVGVRQRILLQLNLASEESKGGFSASDFEKAIPILSALNSVEISGLMTMPPLFENAEEARPYFKKLKELQLRFSSQLPSLRDLSMGTSSDFLIAAEEGSTLVRLGTLLFGERPQRA